MASNTPKRSHSPPLPPNATYHHPVISLNILPTSKIFVAGSKLTGVLEVLCKEQNKVALGQLAIEFLGIEELKLLDHSAQSPVHGPHKCLFQGPSLPPSNAVASTEAPIGGHYYTALRGRTKFPFSFPLPSKLPSSVDFENKARLFYTLKATCQVLNIKSKQNVLVTQTRPIQLVERVLDWNDARQYEPVEMRGELREPGSGGAGVWAEVKIDKKLHWNNPVAADGDLLYARLTVKNGSRRALTSGISAKLCRRLILPDDKISDQIIHVVRTRNFKGPEYHFPAVSGEAKTVDLVCHLPSTPKDTEDIKEFDLKSSFSAKGLKLFSVDMFLRVELELGALSNDLVIDLPLQIVHPASLPKEAHASKNIKSIQHVPSCDLLSLRHLTKPSSSSRPSPNSPRSTSPHPFSLQPGGGSRCSSPQPLSAYGSPADWGSSVMGDSSLLPSAHFSPLPTPRHSPLPSARFSSPFPLSSAHPPSRSPLPIMHQELAGYPNPSGSLIASNAPEYTPQPRRYSEVSSHHQQLPPMSHALHTSSWSSAPIGQHPYPSQLLPSPSFPSQDSYSASQASENAPSYYSNNAFSPPPSTWNRQTHSNTPASMTHTHDPGSQPVLRSTSSLSFGAASSHPNYHYSAPQQLPTSPLPHGQSFEAIRPRHQSLPPVPAAKSQLEPFSIQNQLNNASQLSTNLEGIGEESNTFSAPLGTFASDPFRRISAPTVSNQQLNETGSTPFLPAPISSQKRALPTLPMGSRHSLPPSVNPSAGLCVDLASKIKGDIEEDADCRPSSWAQPNLAVKNYRLETIGEAGESRSGTMTHEKLPTDYLNSLSESTDIEESEDEECFVRNRSIVRVVSQPKGMRPRRSEGSESVKTLEEMVADEDKSNELIAQSENICNDGELNFQNTSSTVDVQQPFNSKSVFQSRGLANLAQFLTRPTSTNTDSESSAKSSRPPSQVNLLTARESQAKSESLSAKISPPSGLGVTSALRLRSSNISFDSVFVDAVPSASSASKPNSAPCNNSVDTPCTWKPPIIERPRKLTVEQFSIDDDAEEKEAQGSKTVIKRESIAPDALFFPQSDGRDTHPRSDSPAQLAPKICTSPPEHLPSLPQTVTPLLTTTKPLVKKKSSKSPKPQQRSLTNSLKPEAKKSFIAPQSAACEDQVSTTLVERLRSQNTARKVPDRQVDEDAPEDQRLVGSRTRKPSFFAQQRSCNGLMIELDDRPIRQEQIKLDKRKQNANDVQEHTCPVEAIDRSMLDVSQNQSQFERPLARELTEPVMIDVALSKHVVSQDKGWAEYPLVSESHYKHGMGAGFSFESESILKKLENRFALLERCKENENVIQRWSLTENNFNNCATRQPLSSLKYSNSRFSLPSQAKAIENLSALELDKGLSLAPERIYSESPSRKPPSRAAASEANLSVPAADFPHLKALSNSGSDLSEGAIDDSNNPSPEGENQKLSSPTNLSRKSRIKRQVSATIDTTQADSYQRRSSMISSRDDYSSASGGDCLTINRVPGGWNEAETNEIEADLIRALQETNVAVQKATSKRLSTPVFRRPVSIHSPTALADLSGADDKYAYQHCLASSVNHQQILDKSISKLSAPLTQNSSRSPNARISLLDGDGEDDMNSKPFPSGSELEDEVMSGGVVDDFKFDENQPIKLTSGEYKSLRGGRGGRVSSVAAQWAKMAASEKAKLSGIEKSLSKSSRNGNDGSEALKRGTSSGGYVSNRAISIREREPQAVGRPLSSATTTYSIADFLGRRNSSTRSSQSRSGYELKKSKNSMIHEEEANFDRIRSRMNDDDRSTVTRSDEVRSDRLRGLMDDGRMRDGDYEGRGLPIIKPLAVVGNSRLMRVNSKNPMIGRNGQIISNSNPNNNTNPINRPSSVSSSTTSSSSTGEVKKMIMQSNLRGFQNFRNNRLSDLIKSWDK